MSYRCIECGDNLIFQSANYICDKCNVKIGMIDALKQVKRESDQKKIKLELVDRSYDFLKKIFNEIDSVSFSINYFRYYIILDFFRQVLWETQEVSFDVSKLLKEVSSTKTNDYYRTLTDLNIQLAQQYQTIIYPINFINKFARGNFVIDFIEFDTVLKWEMIDLLDKYGHYRLYQDDNLVDLLKFSKELILKLSNDKFIYIQNISEEKNHINLVMEKSNYIFNDKSVNYKKYSNDNSYKHSNFIIVNSNNNILPSSNNFKSLFFVAVILIMSVFIFFN